MEKLPKKKTIEAISEKIDEIVEWINELEKFKKEERAPRIIIYKPDDVIS